MRTVFALIEQPLVCFCFVFFPLDLIKTAGCSQTRSCPRTTFAGRRLTEELTRTLMKSDEMLKTSFPATV